MEQFVSFGSLRAMTEATTGKKTPRPCELRRNGGIPLLYRTLSPDGYVEAYAGGFALYCNGQHRAVLRIDACRQYVYEFTDGRQVLDLQTLEKMEWPIPLVLIGEDRIQRFRGQKYAGRETPLSDTEEGLPAYTEDFLQKIRIQQTLENCGKLSRTLLILRYRQGLSLQEIARRYAIRPDRASRAIRRARREFQEKLHTRE